MCINILWGGITSCNIDILFATPQKPTSNLQFGIKKSEIQWVCKNFDRWNKSQMHVYFVGTKTKDFGTHLPKGYSKSAMYFKLTSPSLPYKH